MVLKAGSINRSKRPARGALTIADVAAAAGVSSMTVSRVINGETTVRANTRDRIREVIAELNYSPNSAAQSLAGTEPIRIGLLYSNPSSAYLSEFLVGSLDQARVSYIQLIVEKCDVDQHEDDVAREMLSRGIDGLILPPPLCDSAGIHKVIAEMGALAVAVASGCPAPQLSAVRIDDFAAAKAMTKHIIALGHRRIGFVTGHPNQTASEQRLEGYRSGLVEAGIPVDAELIAPGLFTYRSGLAASNALLDLADRPTAIFASNDDMAAAVVAVAHRRSLDVPNELSVCGFDDTDFARSIWPELTTIHQPIADMSRAAVELLVSKIRFRRTGKDDAVRQLRFDFALIRRGSDAPPRILSTAR